MKIYKNFTILSLCLAIGLSYIAYPIVGYGATLSELQKQAEQYRKNIAQKKQETNKKKQDAQLLNQAITKINSQINRTQSEINQTSTKIDETTSSISQIEKQISQKEDELANQQALQAEALRTLYVNGDQDLVEILFTEKSFSAVIEQNTYLETLEAKIESTINQITTLKRDLEKRKNDLQDQRGNLEMYKYQQENSKKSLDSQKNQKSSLLNATNNQIQSFLSDIDGMQKKVADLQKQIDTLIATSAWGSDIVSANDSLWYYSQLDYPDSHLGNSPYTIAQYGCLITSLAMVATYYGNRVNPPLAVARSNFNSEGYLLSTNIVDDGGSQSVNWGVIDQELAQGHPVIVGVYLPRVGNIGNSYGVSHFVVLKSKIGDNKYTMHDPLGSGRSYGISQIKAMRIIRP